MLLQGLARRIIAASFLSVGAILLLQADSAPSPIRFELKKIPFRLENDETPATNAPETMPGGVAVFDYNGDGRPDIFFTNGANIATLKKDSPKYRNRLFRNDGNGVFTDVTDAAGLAGSGYDMGVAVADYDNDGHPDLFVAGLHHSTLYHNNGDGTFTDVTVKVGLDASLNRPDPEYRAALGDHRRLGRREQRRPARSLRRQLHAVDLLATSLCARFKASPTTAVPSSTRASPTSSF